MRITCSYNTPNRTDNTVVSKNEIKRYKINLLKYLV